MSIDSIADDDSKESLSVPYRDMSESPGYTTKSRQLQILLIANGAGVITKFVHISQDICKKPIFGGFKFHKMKAMKHACAFCVILFKSTP